MFGDPMVSEPIIWWILQILHDPRYLIPFDYFNIVYQGHPGFLVSTVGAQGFNLRSGLEDLFLVCCTRGRSFWGLRSRGRLLKQMHLGFKVSI